MGLGQGRKEQCVQAPGAAITNCGLRISDFGLQNLRWRIADGGLVIPNADGGRSDGGLRILVSGQWPMMQTRRGSGQRVYSQAEVKDDEDPDASGVR